MLWHFAVKPLLATNFVPKSAVVTRPASWPRVRDSITSVWFSIHWRLERGALAPSGMRNSRDSLRSSRAWFDHSGLRYAQTSNPNHAVVRYAHSLGWVFPKWRVVSWRTRVREARMMRLCTRVYTHEGSATQKWGTAPHEEWDPCKEPQNFKEESTENQFPWPLYPFPIIECWWWCVPGPKSPFCFVEIGFRDLRWNLIKTLIHCTSLLSHIPYPNSSGTFISWTASYRPVTTIIVRIGFREFDQV